MITPRTGEITNPSNAAGTIMMIVPTTGTKSKMNAITVSSSVSGMRNALRTISTNPAQISEVITLPRIYASTTPLISRPV